MVWIEEWSPSSSYLHISALPPNIHKMFAHPAQCCRPQSLVPSFNGSPEMGEMELGHTSRIRMSQVARKLICWFTTTHFPTELKQCRKFDQRSDLCFLKAKRVYKKTSLTVKSNKSGFWSYFKSKLRNFETRFQARYTWPRVLWDYQQIALE